MKKKYEALQDIIETLEYCKTEIIMTYRDNGGNLPQRYWSKADTIVSKMNILQELLHDEQQNI